MSTVVYSIANLSLAIYHASIWFFTVFTYYALIASSRFLLLYISKRSEREKRRAIFCLGIVMLFINICMCAMMAYTVRVGRAELHSGKTVLALGVYSLGTIIFNISSFLYSRRAGREITAIAYRTVCLTASLMSLFNFQNTLAYSINIPRALRLTIGSLTAAFCAIFVLILSVLLILKGRGKVKSQAT
ncbi:MAG: hypothetical protein IIX96_04060 [Clostridia bacterium]|nr:hypothetical protein [Clostridia bacterium]